MNSYKIGIVNKKGSFSDEFIRYCKENAIAYKIINPYSTNIIEEVDDCDAIMFHMHQNDYRDMIFAKSLLFSLQTAGKKVFPDFNTVWHFDDKIAQKYLLEAIKAPVVPTYIFYTEKEALEWIKNTTMPKVFKLRGGAGASNVKLAHTKEEATQFVKKAFGKGYEQYRWKEQLKEEYRKFKNGKCSLRTLLRPIYLQFFKKYPTDFAHYHGKECGYAYFQEFIPNNTFDIRICVVGDKAFGLKRLTRKNDFRASGSGNIIYNKEDIDERCVKIAFETNKELKMQSVAYDFVFDKNNNPLIVEISFGYVGPAYKKCEGYWSEDMQWHPGEKFDFCGWMIENLINKTIN